MYLVLPDRLFVTFTFEEWWNL